jgi:trimethylamine--corrinoid protein Co-methyltransferase
MKSGAPMAGTPEISLMNFMIGQMARHYGVPWRTSNALGGAKTFDAQAGYESAATLMASLHAGANYIWHSAGWNEAGMHCSVAKFVVDAEQCAMAYRMAEGPKWDDFDEALKPRPRCGAGGALPRPPAHPGRTSRRAFFMPELFDNNSIEQWIADGSQGDHGPRAGPCQGAAGRLRGTEAGRGVDEALRDYIARREREIPAVEALNQEF